MTKPLAHNQVWVRDRIRHTPAHRVPLGETPPADEPVAAVIVCPPFLVYGGHVITFREAGKLEAFPCLKCWPEVPQHGWPL